LAARLVTADEMPDLEPTLAAGIHGVRLNTGYAVAPAAATEAFARRARRAGADIRVGSKWDGDRSAVGSVLVAGGPWSVDLVPGWSSRPPIRRLWGVVATVDLAKPPRHILEELGIAAHKSAFEVEFSLMTAGGSSSLGSTFLVKEPDPDALVGAIREHGRLFVPEVGTAPVMGVRLCARPVSFDGRPLIGAVPGEERLFVCAGHGPWGISTGPASARLVVDVMLTGAPVPEALRASRF
jgi:glycine/D-amino acid oxidase-like deaminating enzyme